MALKAAPVWACDKFSCTQLALGTRRSGSGSNLRFDLEKTRKWECCGRVLTQRAKMPVEDEKPMTPRLLDAPVENDQTNLTESRALHRDLNSLLRPLSATDPFCSPSDGSKMRVAYQGVPGACSEAAALKAYPKRETVSCDHFEATFKAVELWLLDKAVLPIKNSALAQCEMTLNKLGVVKVNADDTPSAAQTVASDGLRLEQLQALELQRCMDLTFLPKEYWYFKYLFYIDFEASMAEPRAQHAMGHLQEFAKFIRVLGCYPVSIAR